MDECIEFLGGSKVFSSLEANVEYWQAELAERDRDETAFVTHHRRYRCTQMPFGLKNAPAFFQRFASFTLASSYWQTATVHLGDVIVFSDDAEQHFDQVDFVLRLMSKAATALKLEDWFFFSNKSDYLGHLIFSGRL